MSEMTERQQEIKVLLDQGKTPREIGEILDITENGVFQHVRRMRGAGHLPAKAKSGGTKRRTRVKAPSSAPKPQAAPAPVEARVATPLQAIRHRRDEINRTLKAAADAQGNLATSYEQAKRHTKALHDRHAAELKSLDAAEKLIAPKRTDPAPKAASRPRPSRSKAKLASVPPAAA